MVYIPGEGGRNIKSQSYLWEKPCRGHPVEAMKPGVSMWANEGKSTVQMSQAWKSR